MKSKDRSFLEDSYDINVRSKKKSKQFHSSSNKNKESFFEEIGLMSDKFGNPIGIGDFVQIKSIDNTSNIEVEIIDVNRGGNLTVSYDNLLTNESVVITDIKANTVKATKLRH